MALSVLNNIGSLFAQNQLSFIRKSLQTSLFRLASGSRINSGADDAAGLAIADGLRANVTALPIAPGIPSQTTITNTTLGQTS
ncbi:MAG: hypothetical protein O7A06_03435, partial [Acidobacteria bacterium]|nr:hypothetical protein [Acidobacteriota bacterium]